MPVPIAKLSCKPAGSRPNIDKAPAAIRISVTKPPVIIGEGETQIASTKGASENHALGAYARLSTPAAIPATDKQWEPMR